MSVKRDSLVDCLKGYACILVVLDHVLLGLENALGVANISSFALFTEDFIGKFHVALFMFLSGYVFNITGGVEKRGLWRTLLHKLINIGVPYFAFSAIYIMLNSLVGSGVNTAFKASSILTLWYKPVAQYWFLYALMLLFICYSVLSTIMPKTFSMIALFLVYLLSHYVGVSIGVFSAASNVALVFGLGFCAETIDFSNVKIRYRLLFGAFCMVCLMVIVNLKVDIPQTCQIVGICGSIAIVSVVINNDRVKEILLFVCKYSLPIYLLHTIFTSAVRIVLMKFGVRVYILHLIAGIISGFAFSIIVGYFMKKSVWLELLLYPSATYRKLSEKEKK